MGSKSGTGELRFGSVLGWNESVMVRARVRVKGVMVRVKG